MSLAGVINGSYTGNAGVVVGESIPAAPFENFGYMLTYCSPHSLWYVWQCDWNAFYIRYQPSTTDGMHPTDAKFIDDKIDDGLAHSGDVQSQYSTGTICHRNTTTAGQTGTYILNRTDKECRVYIKID